MFFALDPHFQLTIMVAALALASLLGLSTQADSLTLSAALARARASRGAAGSAHFVVDEARAQKRITSAVPNPLLQYYNKETDPGKRLWVEQRFDWLLRWPAVRAAGSAGIERAAADSTQRMANIGREVRLAFYGALAERDRLRISTELAAVADTLDMLATRRLDAGDISIVERDRFNLEAARARRVLSSAREAYQVALAELLRATAGSRAQQPEPQGSLADGLNALPDTTEVAVEAIPLLGGALADSVRFARQLAAARLSMVPLPSLWAGQEWDDSAARERGTTAIFGVSVPVPLWSQRREYTAEAAAQARLRSSELKEARAETARLLADGRTRLTESARRARIARDTLLPTAQRIRSQTVRLYEAGRVAVLDVFEALRVERELATSTIDDLLNYQRALADWYALLGRYQ